LLLTVFILLLGIDEPKLADLHRIEAFEFEGNFKTKNSTILRLSELHQGQQVQASDIAEARERIISSGLFESVECQTRTKQNEITIKFTVEEKMSWFIAPGFQSSGGQLAFAGIFGESNFLGYGKKLLLFGDYGPELRRFVLAYRDEDILGSRYILDFDLLLRRDEMSDFENREEIREVLVNDYGVRILPGIQWTPRLAGLIGVYYHDVHQSLRSGNPPSKVSLKDGRDTAIAGELRYVDMKNFYGILDGWKTGLEMEAGSKSIGGNFNYYRQVLRFQGAMAFAARQMNWQNHLSLSIGKDLPYYREFSSGGTNLRGYLSRQFRGDTKFGIGEELYFPIHEFEYVILRGTVFYNMNIIYFRSEGVGRDAWRNGAGSGVRLYLKSIAVPIVGFDAAWGFEDQAYSTYLTIGASF